MTFRRAEQPYVIKLALARVSETMYELIEPVQGPNTYEGLLNERGKGLHHLGYFVSDIDAAIEDMESKGYSLLQSGRGFGTGGDGAYVYFETERAIGCIVEAIELPQELPAPEGTFPEET